MKRLLLCCALCGSGLGAARGQSTLDTVGATALRAEDATLTGLGVNVAQIESAPNPFQFETSPGSAAQPAWLFAYRSTAGGSGTFPNRVGSESSHADAVAFNFYATDTGVAPGLRHVANYETNYFYQTVIQARQPVTARVFNQSFEFGGHNAAQDQAYDDYIAEYHTVVASGIGNGGAVLSPADCYNGLGVAAYGGSSSTGPTADGRCKPDIAAPAGATSFSTPLVSGAAAILIQGGRRLGIEATAAVDSRTVKALLLNGAVKPPGWTTTPTAPLDVHYGAGVLNVFNSYADLNGRRHPPAAAGLSRVSGHPPLMSGTPITVPQGWDYRAITSGKSEQGVNHYLITTSQSGALVTTLVWNRGYGQSAINGLALFVYDSRGDVLGSSVSTVDNVQHIYLTGLPPGTYEVEVVKRAGPPGTPGMVTPREVYALAWDFER